ncbi:hypothetical protein RB595_002011 [Gaeumannomyces hyphopodioides]
MPRFNFPIPGRRSKAKQPLSPALPSPGGPGPRQQLTSLTKAQRILGTSDINVDGGAWDAWSNSGISISISEDTESAADEGRTKRRQERSGQDREGRDETESGVIPRALDRRLTALGAGGEAASGDETDDLSSMRRRQSSSTIASYYDKSKQPLSISQQTSSSAMAMGVPTVQPGAAAERKKKPARLDLSHMMPRLVNRSLQANLPGGGRASRASVMGHETFSDGRLSQQQPAQEQPSHPPPIRQRVEPKHRNSMADLIGTALRRDTRAEDAARSARESGAKAAQSQAQANALHNLYSHYEQQLVFRGMLSPPQAEDAAKSPFSPSSQGYLSPDTVASGSTARPESGDLSTPRDAASGTETPDTAVLTPQLAQPPAGFGSMSSKALAAAGLGDCSASVSSRHTRTSKASKRTTLSGFDMDLKQNSVLSLSSDSDDDLFDTPSKSSASVPPESPGDPPTSELPPLPPGARSSMAPARRDPRVAKMAATRRGNGIDPKAAKTAQALAPPTVNPRTSSLATATATTAVKQNLPRAPSRLSTTSNLTINTLSSSIASILSAGPPAGLSVHSSAQQKSKASSVRETKNIVMVPTRPTHRHQSSTASVDFYLRSQHNSSALSFEPPPGEEAEEHSEHASSHTSRASAHADHTPQPKPPTRTTTTITTTTTTTEDTRPGTPSSSRYMAVTRQEELLLAALRLKRARMRESILAEYESSVSESRASSRAESRASPPALGVSSGRISRATAGGGSTASHGHHRGRSGASNTSVLLSPRPGHRHKLSSGSSSSQQPRRSAASPPSSGHDRPASPVSPLTAAFASAAAKGRRILDSAVAAAAPPRSILDEFDDLLDDAAAEHDITAAFPVPGRQSTLPAAAEDRLAPLERVGSSRAYRRAAAQRQAKRQQTQPAAPHDAGLSPPSRQHSTRQLAPPVLAHHQRERSPQSDRSARSQQQQQQQRGRSSHSRAESPSPDRHHSQPRATAPEPPLYSPMPRMKAVRISAVGGTAPGGVEMGWWGDDG